MVRFQNCGFVTLICIYDQITDNILKELQKQRRKDPI